MINKKIIILIPTYNNKNTLNRVLNETISNCENNEIVVVNDGSTDNTDEILNIYKHKITILKNNVNLGKGYALRKGFNYAINKNADYVITMDSDGQHFATDLPKFYTEINKNFGAMFMGSRNMSQEGIPSKSTFGNKFSNFWFFIETGIKLPDTQTGFRAYPISKLKKMKFFTKKFEFEIEIIVHLAWRGIKFIPIPVSVLYDENERVSHFRPFKDFFRISILNSILVTLSLFWYYPKKLFSINTFYLIKNELVKKEESSINKSLSLAFGVFMGIIPIWGFQLLIGIPLSVFFRLNKILFIASANISIPPMIPFILWASYYFGGFVVKNPLDIQNIKFNSLESIHLHFIQYLLGAILLSCLAFVLVFVFSFLILKIFRKN